MVTKWSLRQSKAVLQGHASCLHWRSLATSEASTGSGQLEMDKRWVQSQRINGSTNYSMRHVHSSHTCIGALAHVLITNDAIVCVPVLNL